jgi:hypothetical protein
MLTTVTFSFVLQDYLAQAQSGGEMGRSAGVSFNFVFYLREDISGAEEGHESSGTASAGTACTLYQPAACT